MSVEGKNVIFILGGPGSGKGTNAKRAAEEFGFGYAAAGDLLREKAKDPNNERSREIAAILDKGGLVPPEMLIHTLNEAILQNKSQFFLLDGFPRSLAQDDDFHKHSTLKSAVIFLDCPEDVLLARLSDRSLESGRSDDKPDVIPKRIATFKRETAPVIERYENDHELYRIDSNKPPEEVYNDFIATLRKQWTF